MIPIQKVKDIIAQHNNLESELSSGKIDPKLFAEKSKAYSNLGNILTIAREYVNFENENVQERKKIMSFINLCKIYNQI